MIKSRSVNKFRAEYRLAPSQCETLLRCNAVSHWLGSSLESTLKLPGWQHCLPNITCQHLQQKNGYLITEIYILHQFSINIYVSMSRQHLSKQPLISDMILQYIKSENSTNLSDSCWHRQHKMCFKLVPISTGHHEQFRMPTFFI